MTVNDMNIHPDVSDCQRNLHSASRQPVRYRLALVLALGVAALCQHAEHLRPGKAFAACVARVGHGSRSIKHDAILGGISLRAACFRYTHAYTTTNVGIDRTLDVHGMGRWKPNARSRLEQSALELYSARGFEHTTVAEIAARAGLTERTFFRHFADKREVLFAGASSLQEFLVQKVAEAPDSLTPIDAVAAALGAAEDVFPAGLEYARQRQRVITANAELQERELIKLASLSVALANELQRRGVEATAAGLIADAGMAIFKIAYARRNDASNQLDFAQLVRDALDELRAVTAGR